MKYINKKQHSICLYQVPLPIANHQLTRTLRHVRNGGGKLNILFCVSFFIFIIGCKSTTFFSYMQHFYIEKCKIMQNCYLNLAKTEHTPIFFAKNLVYLKKL